MFDNQTKNQIMECTECGKEVEQIDTTYANYDSERARKGKHTGDIYECIGCEIMFINNLIEVTFDRWFY